MTEAADLAVRMVDAHNDGDDQALLAGYAPGALVSFGEWTEPVPAEAWVAAQAEIRESFPDLRFAVRTVGTAPGAVLVELTMTGTNSGLLHLGDVDRVVLRTDALSLPATGRRMSVDGVVVMEVTDGTVTSERHYWPSVESLVQLGLVVRRGPVPELADATG